MDALRILNTREVKPLLNFIEKRWGFAWKPDHVFLESNKKKIYIASKDVGNLPLEKLRINTIGLYFGERVDDMLRLSMEGSQIIGKEAKQNIIDFDDDEAAWWFGGLDIDKDTEEQGYIIVRHNGIIIGCAKATGNKILNYVPKIRRLKL